MEITEFHTTAVDAGGDEVRKLKRETGERRGRRVEGPPTKF